MPKTVLQLYEEGLRKEKDLAQKEEVRSLLHARKLKIQEQAALIEKEVTLSSKEKRQAKKLIKENNNVIRKCSISSSDDGTEKTSPGALLGFKAILEHLRRDRHCLLCPNLSVVCITQSNEDFCIDLFSNEGDEKAELHLQELTDFQDFTVTDHSVNSGSDTHGRTTTPESDGDRASPLDADVSAGFVLPRLRCTAINHNETTIAFTLDVRNAHARQEIVLSLPRFYYPEGLTLSLIDEKVAAAVSRVFAEDEQMVGSMSNLACKVSVGKLEGAKLNKELTAEHRDKLHESHLHQTNQMKAAQKDKEVRQWTRILHTTGAARQKNQEVCALAARDVAIINREVTGKHTHKSSKGWHLQEVCAEL